MPKPKKLRADSKFAPLSEAERVELDTLLLEGGTLEAGVEWMRGHGIEISQQSVSEYYRRHVLPRRHERMAACAAELNKADKGGLADAAIAALKQRTYELMTEPGTDTETALKFFREMLSAQKVQHDDRKLALLEKKAKQAEEAEQTLQKSDLSPEQRIDRMREIFGMH